MEKSIESIWKEGFLENDLLIAPKVNKLYNQKSKLLGDKLRRKLKANVVALVIMAPVFLVIYYFLDATWQGAVIAALFLGLAWYTHRQLQQLNTIPEYKNSYELLKFYDSWLKKIISKNVIVMRMFYPLTFLTAAGTIFFAGNNETTLADRFPGLMFVGGVPLIGLVSAGVIALLMAYFSDKIYRFDIRLMYGRIMKKMEETIADIEELRKEAK